MSYDYLFKLVSVGNPNVGKTAFADQLITNNFYLNYSPTVGVDFRTKSITLDHSIVVKTHIWDTAGDTKFARIVRNYYRNTAGALIIYDVGSRESFNRVDFWRNEILRSRDSKEPMSILLVANKVDMADRVVTRREGENYALRHNLLYAECSPKSDMNVQEAFEWLVIDIYEKLDGEKLGVGVDRHFSYSEEPDIKTERRSTPTCCNIF